MSNLVVDEDDDNAKDYLVDVIFSQNDIEQYSIKIEDFLSACDYIFQNSGSYKQTTKALGLIKTFKKQNIAGIDTTYYSVEVDPGSLRDFLISDNDMAFIVEFRRFRDIFINGIQIKNFRTSSQSQEAFEYVYEHPNQWITYDDLRENSGLDDTGNNFLTRTINDLVDDWQFKGILREAFFRAGKNKLMFRKHITNDELSKESYSYTDIFSFLISHFSPK